MAGSHIGLRNVPDGFAVKENYDAVIAAMTPPHDSRFESYLVKLTFSDGRKLSIARAAIAYVIETRQ